MTSQTIRGARLAEISVLDFSGGLNLRDAPSELDNNESPDLMNITLDERGGAVKRLGISPLSSALGSSPLNFYYSAQLNKSFVQDGAALKMYGSDFSVAPTTVKTFSTAERVGMCDFKSLLLAVHPVDGLGYYDGTTWTQLPVLDDAGATPMAGAPRGTTVIPFQNKVHIAGNPAQPSRVYGSAPGDQTLWDYKKTSPATGAYYVDVRENNDAPITCLGAGQGMDVSGRPGLMVLKKHSWHRINSVSGTDAGNYTTLHNQAGAANAISITSVSGWSIAINDLGVWQSNGVDPPDLVSHKLEPLFKPTQINFAKTNLFCAGRIGERAVFSIPFGPAQLTNNRTLEYHPNNGWFSIHDFGASCFTTWMSADERLYHGSPTAAKVYWTFHDWSDDGVPIASRFQSRWWPLNANADMRVRHLRLIGRGRFTLYTKLNYETSDGVGFDLGLVGGSVAMVWNTNYWNDGSVWGPAAFEGFSDLWELGFGRSVSFLVRENSMASAVGPKLLLDGQADQVGSFALYGLRVEYVPLGQS